MLAQILFLVDLFLIVIGLLIGGAFYRSEALPRNTPEEYLKHRKQFGEGKSVVVFMGDSLTHGRIGVNYVDLIEDQLKGKDIEFINAGKNSELAWNLLQRVEDVIDCDPDVVTILVGTNDANASMVRSTWNDYVKRMKLPREPDIDWFRDSLTSLVDKLKTATSARIALISIPTIGEDSNDPAFSTSSRYSKIVYDVAEETGVVYLPLHEMMAEHLQGRTTSAAYTFEKYFGGILKGIISHYLLRKKWDSIAKTSGFSLHVDYLHLNSAGAKMVADLVVEFLKSTLTQT